MWPPRRFLDQGLRAYFGEAFSTALRMSAVSWDSKLDQSMSAALLDEQPISEGGRDLLSTLLERKCESHLEPESSEEVTNLNWCRMCLLKIDVFTDIPGLPRRYAALTLSLLLKLLMTICSSILYSTRQTVGTRLSDYGDYKLGSLVF